MGTAALQVLFEIVSHSDEALSLLVHQKVASGGAGPSLADRV